MDFSTIVNYVKRYVTEYFPDVSFREGTAAYDLFLKGFAILCRGFLNTINRFISYMDPRNYASMSEDSMDVLGALWFLSRRVGGVSYGQARVYLSSPSAVKLNAGFTVLSSTGLKFSTNGIYSFSQSQIESNRQGSRYYFDITVYAQGTGDTYNVPAGGIVDIETPFYLPWENVENLNAMINGSDAEDNEEFYYRIYNSVNTRDLLITKGSVEATLLSIFGTIGEIDVLGYGDIGMERDVVYNIILPEGTPYRVSSFDRKSRGVTVYNKSKAMFASDPLMTDASGEPILENLSAMSGSTEYSQEDYDAVARHDLIYYTHSGGIVFSDTFDNTLGVVVYDVNDWVASDSGYAFGELQYGNSVSISVAGELVMGATFISPEVL